MENLVPLPALALDTIVGPVQATVVKVYDGDTLTVEAHPWPQMSMRISVRIQGIDTPELRGKCDGEKTMARNAKLRAIELAGDAIVLTNIVLGKYAGRVVATVHTPDGVDIGRALVAEGYARAYDGGARAGWCA